MNTINPHIFREFSIRGIADEELTDPVVTAIGQAIGRFFAQRQAQSLIIGHDVRLSSPRISQALINGMAQTGLTLHDCGLVPTPVLNFATDFHGADGGIMITASHNPPDYNGLKIRADDTLYGDDLQQIYQWAVAAYEAGTAVSPHTPHRLNPIPDYCQKLKTHAQAGRRLKVVVDGGSGANGRIVSQLLTELDCDVVELYCDPDGRFPHRQPDPTAVGATDDLAATVLAHQADLGFAYDGDGDRVVIVDEKGQTVYGDQIMMLLARDILQAGPATIIYEVLCSQALADDIVAHGGQAVMTPSGYFFIQQAMKAETAALGGELSGHLFLNEPGFRFDDAILASVKLLNSVRSAARALSQLTADLPGYHSSPEIRLTCADGLKTVVVQQAITHYQKQYHVETIDGARIHFRDGWGLVRQSNTQPKISMRFEARSAAALQAIQNDVQSFVESTIQKLTT